MPEENRKRDGEAPKKDAPLGKTFLVLSASATILLVLSLILKFYPLGIEGEWAWEYLSPGQDLFPLLFPTAILLCLLALLRLFLKEAKEYSRPFRWGVLAALVILALFFQFAIGALGNIGTNEAIWVVISPGASDYFGQSQRIENLRQFLADYPTYIRREFKGGEHISTHPPGMILYWWTLRRFFQTSPGQALGKKLSGSFAYAFDLFQIAPSDRAAVLAGIFLMRLLAALALLPTYLLAKRFCGEKCALVAAAFMILLPGVSLFSPKFDTMLPLFSVGLFYLVISAADFRSNWRAFVAGLVFSVSMLLTFAILVVPFLLLLYWLFGRWRGGWARMPRGKAVLCWGFGLSGFILPLALLFVFLQLNSLTTWIAVYHQHAATYTIKHWTYWKWVLYNPFEFAVFLGIPLSALFLHCFVFPGNCLIKRKPWPADGTLLFSFILTLLLLNFSGKSLSEVGRLWIFLMPFAIIITVSAVNLVAARRGVLSLLLTLQFVQVIFMKLFLKVLLVGQDLSILGSR
ncbi:MAG: hypothetical protein AMS15_03020 [Planctomycetes bacterium DG_23]|nr:MAG: hypothetical protein AMS15_03020 [Planctomycetes bacterium DG_23]